MRPLDEGTQTRDMNGRRVLNLYHLHPPSSLTESVSTPPQENHNTAECLRLLAQLMLGRQQLLASEEA